MKSLMCVISQFAIFCRRSVQRCRLSTVSRHISVGRACFSKAGSFHRVRRSAGWVAWYQCRFQYNRARARPLLFSLPRKCIYRRCLSASATRTRWVQNAFRTKFLQHRPSGRAECSFFTNIFRDVFFRIVCAHLCPVVDVLLENMATHRG